MKSIESKESMVFPEGLTQKDIELIKVQCEHQKATSPEQVLGFAKAYRKAKELASQSKILQELISEQVEVLILDLAQMIEKRNIDGFRKVEVTIRGKRLTPANIVPRAVRNFSEKYADFMQNPPVKEEQEHPLAPSPEKLYKEFEEIHPFEDGNGRVGDLLWKMAVTRAEGKWPETLPPNVFGSTK